MMNPAKFAVLLLVALVTSSKAQSIKPEIYAAEQAQTGATLYLSTCASCHGAQMEGVAAPALKGPAFGELAIAQSLTAQSLLEVTATSMPQSDPGSLKPEEYNAVVAYILQQNGYPAGNTALKPGAAGLKDIKIAP